MRRSVIIGITTVSALLLLSASGFALDGKVISQLKRLNDVDQLEQRCDIEGMERLNADKVISYTFSRPKREPVHLDADGAVFRQNGEWYRLAYSCTTSKDHLTIQSFQFRKGERISHKDWPRLYLYP